MTTKFTMSNLKDLIYLATIIIGIILYYKEKAGKQAVYETKIDTVIENQNNMLEKLKETDIKWENQKEFNGKILMYMELDSH